MDLRINSKSHVPIHVQLEGQIKHLILAGRFEVGSRLPSIRALAGYLRVNRNTVARVISDLEGEGYVESRRGSGVYVVRPPVDEEEAKRHEVLERVMDLTAARGIPMEELAYALLARGGVRPQEKTPILFVECTREELDQFSDELEEQLPVEVESVLLEDLAERVSGEQDLPWRMAVTTFFHVHEVQDIVEPRGIEAVALLAEANIESLRRLTELPEGTPVAVVGWGRTCMENLSRSIEGAGLDHLRFVQVYVDEQTDDVLETLEGVDAVVCASITARKLREIGISRALDIIEEDRVLDQGGIEMLGRMLRERQSNAAG
ncbi:MAG: Predicted transcriptional regulator of N-Acetylglucosamine utilization, GntR family [uncultured Rubrobacteraceae bacterium]|uniref:Predicted transcriptional regulator of N-Acetylglucosamine utilization, GntR family n=1 Tax=uncultured Rubrobacteraceae bacterium TaxID=349277 RepID=A0A6J4R2Y1_9ACTN|nr:MAG: Predicted transcriptional regulator of N-Acetylglucosamine utilization, GntR family [uncultured Rubrobacteraceae bacterium]